MYIDKNIFKKCRKILSNSFNASSDNYRIILSDQGLFYCYFFNRDFFGIKLSEFSTHDPYLQSSDSELIKIPLAYLNPDSIKILCRTKKSKYRSFSVGTSVIFLRSFESRFEIFSYFFK